MDIGELNRHWERVLNTMNEALLVISKKGRIVSVNRSFEEMTGYTAGEVFDRPCTMLECQACEMAINNRGDGLGSRKCAAAAVPSKRRTAPCCRP